MSTTQISAIVEILVDVVERVRMLAGATSAGPVKEAYDATLKAASAALRAAQIGLARQATEDSGG